MRSILPWIIIALSVLSGIALLVYNAMTSDDEDGEEGDGQEPRGPEHILAITAAEKKDELASTTEEYRGSARKSRVMALKESLERSLDSRQGHRIQSKNRMTMPWFLLVGADESGKKTVLSNNGLPQPFGPAIEVDSQRKDAGKWWVFDDAVVLEAPAAAPGTTASGSTLPPDQTVYDASVGWHTLLHMLRRERPDSPLNGIIVTVSCADLLSGRAEPEKLADQADRIRIFLERTRRTLGVRLPLHVIVTKCDTLPGFRTFARTLPADRRDDIFGWANPNDVEARYDAAWIETGFQEMRNQLTSLRDELLAAPEQVDDAVGLFVFDGEFVDMQEPLKDFVSKLMSEGERRPSLFFRGMYFTGDMLGGDGADLSTTQAERASNAVTAVAGDDNSGHSLAFLKSLFIDKIFREAGLARPTARFRFARDRRVVYAQAAALLIVVGGSLGLYGSLYGWKRGGEVVQAGIQSDAETLTRVLSGLAIDLDEVRHRDDDESLDRRARDAAVIELVAQMREVPTMQMRSAFLPTSWFSALPGDIRASMRRGVQEIVLPVTRQRLEERADQLLGFRNGVRDTTVSAELDVQDPRAVAAYLSDVRTLSRNIARYNSLADSSSGSLPELAALLDYLFGEKVSAEAELASADFENALRQASAPKIVVSPAMAASVVNRAASLLSSVATSAAQQLAPRTNPQALRAVNPDDDLSALFGLSALVDIVDAKRGLVATVSDSTILGMRIARMVEDSVDAQLRFVAARLRADTLSPSEAADSLKHTITELFKSRLMLPRENRSVSADIGPNQRLRWDVGRLELALALRNEFLQSLLILNNAFPNQPQERLRRALEVQLRARAIDAAANAQRWTPSVPESNLEIRAEDANLDAATARLLNLSIMFDSLGAGPEGRKLIEAGARQAEHTLAMAQALIERSRPFYPQTAKIASWNGVLPVSFPALGVSDSLTFQTTLINQTTDVRTLAHDVAHALRFLRFHEVDPSHVTPLLTQWEEIANSVARYERGDYTSTLGQLHRYIRDNMTLSDLASCAAVASQPDLDPDTRAMDVFAVRRRQYYAAVVGRCGGNQTAIVAAYQRMRNTFTQRLAGRFPFVDSTQAAFAPDADPVAVREFLREYDAFAASAEVSMRSNPAFAQPAKMAMAFLDQVEQARPFFGPVIEMEKGLPEYSLAVHSGDSDWGTRWRWGDSLHVSTLVDSLGNERQMYVRGGWSALRAWATNRDSTASIRFFHPRTAVELVPPKQFPTAAPELGVPSRR
jgi:type VI secretion system protein ImpL